MTGTILNVMTVAIGSTLGLLIGDRLPQKTQQSVVLGLGVVTVVVGVDNALRSGNIIIPLISLIIGVLIGEALEIQKRLDLFAGWLQRRVSANQQQTTAANAATIDAETARERFISGFVTASLVFCVGPLTFVGSLQDGISGDYELLAIKSVLDGFASLAFAASLGVGVMFSIITIIVVQGGLSLVGILAGDVMSTAMIDEMTATGGLILIALSLVLLDIQKPRVANYLPALLIAPIIVAGADWLGVAIYPNV
jgi:uncharacterized protein